MRSDRPGSPVELGGSLKGYGGWVVFLFDFFEIISEQIFWKLLQQRCWLLNLIGNWRTVHILEDCCNSEIFGLTSMGNLSASFDDIHCNGLEEPIRRRSHQLATETAIDRTIPRLAVGQPDRRAGMR